MSAGAGWQDYAPKGNEGWRDYAPQGQRSAASPIAPPVIQRPNVSMHPSFLLGDPNSDATPQSLPEVATGMAKSMGHLAAMAPVVEHRLLQRHGIVSGSDMFPGEHTMDQVEKQDVPNAALTMLGAEGMEAPEPGVPKIVPQISPPTEGPGMLARVAKVGVQRIPGVKLGTDLLDAVRGPEAPTPEPPKPAKPAIAKVPETGGIQWGTGGKGPIDLRGKMIPAESPVAPPVIASPVSDVRPVTNSGPVTTKPSTYGPPKTDFMGKVPPESQGFDFSPAKDYGATARADVERRMGGSLPRGATEQRAPQIAKPSQWPPEGPIIRRDTGPRTRAEMLDDKSVEEGIRDAVTREDRLRFKDEAAQYRARNDVSTPKEILTGQGDKPIKYTKSAKSKAIGSLGKSAETPTADDLTPEWQRALDEAKARKQRGASR